MKKRSATIGTLSGAELTELVRANFEKVVVGIVVISLMPAMVEGWKARRAR